MRGRQADTSPLALRSSADTSEAASFTALPLSLGSEALANERTEDRSTRAVGRMETTAARAARPRDWTLTLALERTWFWTKTQRLSIGTAGGGESSLPPATKQACSGRQLRVAEAADDWTAFVIRLAMPGPLTPKDSISSELSDASILAPSLSPPTPPVPTSSSANNGSSSPGCSSVGDL